MVVYEAAADGEVVDVVVAAAAAEDNNAEEVYVENVEVAAAPLQKNVHRKN